MNLGIALAWTIWFAPLVGLSITHIGTRGVVSEISGFRSQFVSSHIVGFESSANNEKLRVKRISTESGIPQIRKDIVIYELGERLPDFSESTREQKLVWLKENGFSTDIDTQCFVVYSKNGGSTKNWIGFWGNGKGIFVAARLSQLKTVEDFFLMSSVEGADCQSQ